MKSFAAAAARYNRVGPALLRPPLFGETLSQTSTGMFENALNQRHAVSAGQVASAARKEEDFEAYRYSKRTTERCRTASIFVNRHLFLDNHLRSIG